MSSYTAGGTIPWMSPELLTMDCRPTKHSDCYALGMVIYEVLSGQVPFAPLGHYAAMLKVVSGERPQRPEGVKGERFTDDLWPMLNRCWATRPESRPSSSVILECLERVSRDTKPPPLGVGGNGWNLKKSIPKAFSWLDLRCFVASLRRILC